MRDLFAGTRPRAAAVGARRRATTTSRPDGREIALDVDLAAEPAHDERSSTSSRSTSRTRPQARPDRARPACSDENPRYSPDGRYIGLRVVRHRARVQRPGPPACCSIAGAAALDARSRRDFDRGRDATCAWAPDSQRTAVPRRGPRPHGLYRLPLATPTRRRRSSRGGTVGGFAVSRDGACIAFTRSTRDASAALFALRGDGSGERAIESLNRALLARHALGEVREFTVKGWQGEPVQVWVTYPPDFDPAAQVAADARIHGGPHAAHQRRLALPLEHAGVRGAGLRRGVRQLPRLVAASARSSSRRSPGSYGEKEFADTEAATDFLLRQGYIDRDAPASPPAAATAATWSRT